MRRITPVLAVSCITFMLIGCTDLATNPDPAAETAIERAATAGQGNAHKLPAATRKELAQVRQATTQYHDVQMALDDGYVPISPHVPGMGIHYGKSSLIDETFELDTPEVLIYVANPKGTHYQLVAVEYLATGEDPPAGFTGDADHWEPPPPGVPASWALHAWVWRGNPDGIFNPTNPNVP